MTGFAAEWLALREPYDLRARNPAVLDAVSAAMSAFTSVSVVDLACGTGATLRAVSPRLPTRQSWRSTGISSGPAAGSPAVPRGRATARMPLSAAALRGSATRARSSSRA